MAVKLNEDNLCYYRYFETKGGGGGGRVELDESESNDSQEDDVGRLRVAFNVRRRRRLQ